MTDEELTAQLAEALAAAGVERSYESTRLAARLLPVVRRYGDQRAADELVAAADRLAQSLGVPGSGQYLRARAAALRGQVTT